jgi:hypothetical protein
MNENKANTILAGKIKAGDVECYHLDNNSRVISGSGLQKAFGFLQRKISGDRLKNIVLSTKNKNFSAARYQEVEDAFNINRILFKAPANTQMLLGSDNLS